MSVNSRIKAPRSYVKQKHYIGIKFQSLADTDILVTSGNSDRKIMQSIRITSRPPWRIRKWNQFSQFRWTQ